MARGLILPTWEATLATVVQGDTITRLLGDPLVWVRNREYVLKRAEDRYRRWLEENPGEDPYACDCDQCRLRPANFDLGRT